MATRMSTAAVREAPQIALPLEKNSRTLRIHAG
jgi:hypothetical protein